MGPDKTFPARPDRNVRGFRGPRYALAGLGLHWRRAPGRDPVYEKRRRQLASAAGPRAWRHPQPASCQSRRASRRRRRAANLAIHRRRRDLAARQWVEICGRALYRRRRRPERLSSHRRPCPGWMLGRHRLRHAPGQPQSNRKRPAPTGRSHRRRGRRGNHAQRVPISL